MRRCDNREVARSAGVRASPPRAWPIYADVAFGGDDWKTLFFTSRTMIGSFNVKIPGMPVPAVKKT